MQVNREKTTVKKKITYFLKNYVASKKSLQFANLFYRFVFRCEVLRPFVFYLFEIQSTILVSSEAAIQRCS